MPKSQRVQRLQQRLQVEVDTRQEVSQQAVGYIRVSTEEQATGGYGLESQERAIQTFAESQGYTLVDLVYDAGVSGAKAPETRHGFQRILSMAEEKTFAVLLVWKFDRLARNLVYAVTTANALQAQYGVVLRSVTEPIDTATAMGQMIFAVLAGMAQQERETITARTLGGKKEKSKRGGFAGGSAPLGYVRDKEGGLTILDEEAEIVKNIFLLRQCHWTLQAIANLLNAQGTPTKRGGNWHPATVRYILDNPKYLGQVEYYFRWKGVEEVVRQSGWHQSIISGPILYR